MARCRYCGRQAGFLRRKHLECFERHEKAAFAIPRFFLEAAGSNISAERFSELLQAVAQGSFIVADEFRSLCAAGINSALDQILQARPLSARELQRLIEINETLGKSFASGLGLDERLIKVGIVSDVGEGRIRSCVSVVGPVPLMFETGEIVLWIFNYAQAWRMGSNQGKQTERPEGADANDDGYFSPEVIGKAHFSQEQLRDQTVGDLVLTDRNVYFLKADAPAMKIPIAKIQSLRAYAEGFHLRLNFAGKRPTVFMVNDPWFAVNLIARLI